MVSPSKSQLVECWSAIKKQKTKTWYVVFDAFCGVNTPTWPLSSYTNVMSWFSGLSEDDTVTLGSWWELASDAHWSTAFSSQGHTEDTVRALIPRAGQESQLEGLRDENKITCSSSDAYSVMSFH